MVLTLSAGATADDVAARISALLKAGLKQAVLFPLAVDGDASGAILPHPLCTVPAHRARACPSYTMSVIANIIRVISPRDLMAHMSSIVLRGAILAATAGGLDAGASAVAQQSRNLALVPWNMCCGMGLSGTRSCTGRSLRASPSSGVQCRHSKMPCLKTTFGESLPTYRLDCHRRQLITNQNNGTKFF